MPGVGPGIPNQVIADSSLLAFQRRAPCPRNFSPATADGRSAMLCCVSGSKSADPLILSLPGGFIHRSTYTARATGPNVTSRQTQPANKTAAPADPGVAAPGRRPPEPITNPTWKGNGSMSTIPQQPDTHPALSHRCPFCGADAGTPCFTKFGRELDWPHIRRRDVAEPPAKPPRKQALCCQCGQLRTYKDVWRARHALGDCDPSDRWKRRMVGALKCSHCQAITPHALLADPDRYREVDERDQLLAQGDQPRDQYERCIDLERLRHEYRQAQPRNPYLKHRYWTNEARAAWQAGRREVIALCGEPISLDRDPDGASSDRASHHELIAPSEIHDQDYEDPDTGLWWVEMDCVDCLRVSNTARLKWRRETLAWRLKRIAYRTDELDDAAVDRLLKAVEAVVGECS